MLNEKASILEITRYQALNKIWRNDRLRTLSERIWLDDLLAYLNTGKSKKFDPAKLQQKKLPILFGCWRMDAEQTFSVLRGRYRNISPVDQRRLFGILKNMEQNLGIPGVVCKSHLSLKDTET